MEIATIQNKIYRLPNRPPFMLAQDLADIYETETIYINRAVKRNPDRFPEDFHFQMNLQEAENLVCQNVISKQSIAKEFPYGFTREGANMLSTVLKTKIAAARAVQIMRAFSAMEQQSRGENLDDALRRMEDRIVERLAARMLPPAPVAPRLPVHLATLPDGCLLRCCFYDNQPLVYGEDMLHIIGNPMLLPPKAALRRAKLAEGAEFVVVSVSEMAAQYQCSRRELLADLNLSAKPRKLSWLTPQGMGTFRNHPSGVYQWYLAQRQTFAALKRVLRSR